MPVFQLNDQLLFPPPELAREDGLLAVGGDLSPERLLLAYRQGIFPWFSPEDPILWWAPDPRMVLFPDQFHCSRRLARTLRQQKYHVTRNHDFAAVIEACAVCGDRVRTGTWIDQRIIAAYQTLHAMGYAHSVECWLDGKLAGGLYGIALGRAFFGESMFSRQRDASKVALAHLVAELRRRNFLVIDCQVPTGHLARMGARLISGACFSALLRQAIDGEKQAE